MKLLPFVILRDFRSRGLLTRLMNTWFHASYCFSLNNFLMCHLWHVSKRDRCFVFMTRKSDDTAVSDIAKERTKCHALFESLSL